MKTARLHSIESFGAVDGPGIRTVFFLQGCPARCAYCHNPDTWNPNGGREVEVDEIVHKAKRGVPYYGDDGGVTFSGGEPLIHGEFLLEAIDALHDEEISVAIDTSGTYFDEFSDMVIEKADMLLLDVKHIDEHMFRELTGTGQGPLFDIIESINEHRTPIWIRQVIVPGLNDTEEYVKSLNQFIQRIKSVKKVELLPYHTMATDKYAKLGMTYRFADVKPMDRDRCEELAELTVTA
ncbi:MAG: pyruvate formate-lyase-activating protein [Clostridiales bacterium]|nr:pyruvate formate-lyase-activating protein [Clostridiales bacterium]MDY4060367.1 pyruvate formate-lyase-activating protein [Anaerovoracaceae bacterium]